MAEGTAATMAIVAWAVWADLFTDSQEADFTAELVLAAASTVAAEEVTGKIQVAAEAAPTFVRAALQFKRK